MATVDRDAFESLETALDNGHQLTLEDVGEVFGVDFWHLLVYTLVDAQVAARAIANSLVRLSAEGEDDEEGDD